MVEIRGWMALLKAVQSYIIGSQLWQYRTCGTVRVSDVWSKMPALPASLRSGFDLWWRRI